MFISGEGYPWYNNLLAWGIFGFPYMVCGILFLVSLRYREEEKDNSYKSLKIIENNVGETGD
jgi:hypothetical protein